MTTIVTDIEVITREKQKVLEAFAFIGILADLEEVQIEISTGDPAFPFGMTTWTVAIEGAVGLNGTNEIVGKYPIRSLTEDRLAIIMAMGLTRHPFNWMIYQTITMASQALHIEPNRNSAPEVCLRWVIQNALRTMPVKQIRQHLEKVLHIQENINEENFKRLGRVH